MRRCYYCAKIGLCQGRTVPKAGVTGEELIARLWVVGEQEQGAYWVMIWKIAAAVAALTLSACSTSGTGSGNVAAQAFANPVQSGQPRVGAGFVEAMAGGLVGNLTGAELDSRERRRALEAEYRALEYMQAGQSVTWGRPGSNRYGEVVAGSPYRVGAQNCRQYKHTVLIDQRARTARGAACRNDDGSWTPLA